MLSFTAGPSGRTKTDDALLSSEFVSNTFAAAAPTVFGGMLLFVKIIFLLPLTLLLLLLLFGTRAYRQSRQNHSGSGEEKKYI